MKITLATLVLIISCIVSNAQSSHDFLVGTGLDVIKSDNYKIFDKAQIGVEAHYFLQRRIAIGLGAEIWTRQTNSLMMGVRYYVSDNFFVRFRGLIGINDASIGGGWSKPLSEKVRFEAMGDFYFRGEVGVRGGIAYVIRKQN